MGKNRNEKGFTLIEIMVALILVALAATIVGPAVIRYLDEGRQRAAKSQISLFEACLKNYRLDMSHYPTTSEGLKALREKPAGSDSDRWNGPYIEKPIPLDPWNREYQYLNPGKHNPDGVDIWSLGADGREGGEGANADIGNW